jgi:hypothetical protein
MLIKICSENRNEKTLLEKSCFESRILSRYVISCIVECYSLNNGNIPFCSSHELRTVPTLRIEMSLDILKPEFRQTKQIGEKVELLSTTRKSQRNKTIVANTSVTRSCFSWHAEIGCAGNDLRIRARLQADGRHVFFLRRGQIGCVAQTWRPRCQASRFPCGLRARSFKNTVKPVKLTTFIR